MSDARQRLLDAAALVSALSARVGTIDESDILDALIKARQELREAARAYVAAKEGSS